MVLSAGIQCTMTRIWDNFVPRKRTSLHLVSFQNAVLEISISMSTAQRFPTSFACNSNVQFGDIGHLFYSTIYTSKKTQAEDSRNFLFISSSFASTVQNQLEKRQRASNNDSASSSEEAPDFVEGLVRVMAGIRAHMASTVVSAPMAHLLATRKSRFHLSHETKGLPVAQLEDLEEGNEISYYYRRGKKVNDDTTDDDTDDEEEVLIWPDSFADNYMKRPEDLKEVSAFEFVMKYEVVYKNAQENQDSESSSRDIRSSKRYKGGRLSFEEGHPCKGRAHVRRLKHERVPIIYSKHELIDIALLELNDSDPPFEDSPSEAAKIYREQYARLALLLFYPFTEFSQLKMSRAEVLQQSNDDACAEERTFWCKFEYALQNGDLKPDSTHSFGNIKAEDVLEHIQDRLNCQKLPKCKDKLLESTVCKEGNGSGNKKRRDENDEEQAYDCDFSQIEALFADIDSEAQNYSELADTDERKTDTIRCRADISDDSFVDPPRLAGSSFLYDSHPDDGDDDEGEGSSDDGPHHLREETFMLSLS